MEAVAWLSGEPHSDEPKCACPVITRAMQRLNDRIEDEAVRTELLRPLLPKIVGSRAGRGVVIKRGFVAADMAVRVFAPMALEVRDKLDLARRLRDARPIVDRETAGQGQALASATATATATAYATDYATDSVNPTCYAAHYAAYYSANSAHYAAYYAAHYSADAAYYSGDAAYYATVGAIDAATQRKIYEQGVVMIERMLAVKE